MNAQKLRQKFDKMMADTSDEDLAHDFAVQSQKRYKIVGNYLYAPIESTETFETKEAAKAENKAWTKRAESQGLRWKGRVISSENAEVRHGAKDADLD